MNRFKKNKRGEQDVDPTKDIELSVIFTKQVECFLVP